MLHVVAILKCRYVEYKNFPSSLNPIIAHHFANFMFTLKNIHYWYCTNLSQNANFNQNYPFTNYNYSVEH